jgi:hypothetical protein
MVQTIMDNLVITDGCNYKLAQIIESHKNHYQVELFDDKTKKKIKINQALYPVPQNIVEFNQNVQQLIPQIDIPLLS